MDIRTIVNDIFKNKDIGNLASQYYSKADKLNLIHTPQVTIIKDSIFRGKRLTTFQLRFWRAILPEITRHRCFSFCVRSSRANPVKNILEQVRTNPWGPESFGSNQSGMVAGEELKGEDLTNAILAWKLAALGIATQAETLMNLGVHKQVTNRLLEPFTYSDMVLAGTDFSNFFMLREAGDAQPEIQTLAKAMHKALDESTPTKLEEGQWHLPYISKEELNNKAYSIDDLCKASCARCARVSYKLFDGTTSITKDIELFNKLKNAGHWSPLEFVAVACNAKDYKLSNYKGYNQYRRFYN